MPALKPISTPQTLTTKTPITSNRGVECIISAIQMVTMPTAHNVIVRTLVVKGLHVCFTILFVGCLTSQQHASVSQGRICSDNFTCCHTEIEAADPTFYLTQLQYTDTGPTSPSADPISPSAWHGMTRSGKNPVTSRIRTLDLQLSRRAP